jgi:hypothetical protein
MRPNTGLKDWKKDNYEVDPILNPASEAIRLSELHGEDVAGSNEVQSNVPDKTGAVNHTETGALKHSPAQLRNFCDRPEFWRRTPGIQRMETNSW